MENRLTLHQNYNIIPTMKNKLKRYWLVNLETGVVRGVSFLLPSEKNTFNYAYALNGKSLRYV